MIVELIAPDKMCYEIGVEIIPRKDEYIQYSLEDGHAIEGVVLEVAHSISRNRHSISIILRSLQV